MLGARRKPQGYPITGQIVAGQLPTRGINARDAAVNMQPADAISLVNVLSGSYGMEVRGGYQEFATTLPGALPVPTLMSYYPGEAKSVATNIAQSSLMIVRPMPFLAANVTLSGRLFACTNGQIFDITAGGAGPWTAQAGITATSDYWTSINFQNAGGNFLLATNDEGMYVTYGGSGFSSGFSNGFATAASGFTKITQGPLAGQISGINPDLFVFIMVWKRRLWFIEKASSRAWYLPVDQITGQATLFDFGTSFRHGGSLASLGNWTVDGGEGIDDHLVAVSSEGDVVIYKGYDPDSADTDPSAFQLHGIWYVGALPNGRRQLSNYGGDLYILSSFGISQVSKLVAMSQVAANLQEDIGSRIDPFIVQLMKGTHALAKSWYIEFLPSSEKLIVGVPQQLFGEGVLQLALMLRTMAWSQLLDIPVATMRNHDTLTFGGGDIGAPVSGVGRVFLLFDNALDNVNLAGTSGVSIRGRLTPAYQPLGAPGMLKVFPMVRPTILAEQSPNIKLTMLTDYNTGSFFTVPTLPVISGSLWDVALWNQGLWGGLKKTVHKWFGTVGSGFAATVQMDLDGIGGTRLMSLDFWCVPGGPL